MKLKPDSSAAHYNFATALTLSGRVDLAIGQYQEALRIRPDYALAHNNLGSVLLRLGNPDGALQHFREALRLDPANAEAHYNVGSAFRSRGSFSDAIGQFREAVRLKPDWVPALTSLAWLLATAPDAALRDAAQAIRLAEHATDLTGRQDAAALDVLAAAYATAGAFDRAVAAAQAALDLKPDDPLAAAIRPASRALRAAQTLRVACRTVGQVTKLRLKPPNHVHAVRRNPVRRSTRVL